MLTHALHVDERQRHEDEHERFMQAMIAAHPSKADEIVKFFDDDEPEIDLAAEPVRPQQPEEVEGILADLAQFGISLQG